MEFSRIRTSIQGSEEHRVNEAVADAGDNAKSQEYLEKIQLQVIDNLKRIEDMKTALSEQKIEAFTTLCGAPVQQGTTRGRADESGGDSVGLQSLFCTWSYRSFYPPPNPSQHAHTVTYTTNSNAQKGGDHATGTGWRIQEPSSPEKA
ncbi:MAG: hypothetical protein LQ338_007509 [Usnochroma carphineum]|nr:MAG: hypothetical protein LQ338_007509 [Usnochroma carphineum]